MVAADYAEVIEARTETVRRLVNCLEVPAVIDANDSLINAPVEDGVFLTPSHLFSTALLSFDGNRVSYHLGPLSIPTVQGPSGIYVPAQEPAAHLHRVKLGDNRAFEELLAQFRSLIEMKARSYFVAGYERDDLLVLGESSLFDAACCYDFVSSPFPGFFRHVFQKQIITEIKRANRGKHSPLNHSLRFEGQYSPQLEDGVSFLDTFVDPELTPEAEAFSALGVNRFDELIAGLSELEAEAISLYAEGETTYREIARQMDCDLKKVDNALQRAKRNLRKKAKQQDF